MSRGLALTGSVLALAGCTAGDGGADAGPVALEVLPVISPAPDGSCFPGLARAPSGEVLVSWLEPAEGGPTRLACAALERGTWSAASTVARGDGFFVNWADFPALATTGDAWFATWLEELGEGGYAYGVRMAVSQDRGRTWGAAADLHSDRSESEHGFVSLVTLDASRVHAVWLDGRNTGGGHGGPGAMALFAATVATTGATIADGPGIATAEHALDERVCDCCQTDSCLLDDGSVVVVYRDRSPDEVRDVAFVRGDPADAGSWSAPMTIWSDGWAITGCPVNGPAVCASGPEVAVAWFTLGSDSRPRVQVVRSDDGARTFGPPLRIDDGAPLGRVDATFVGDTLIVSWLETAGESAQWKVRALGASTGPGPSTVVAEVPAERASGFLRLAAAANDALAAWTGPGPRVELARIEPGERP